MLMLVIVIVILLVIDALCSGGCLSRGELDQFRLTNQ